MALRRLCFYRPLAGCNGFTGSIGQQVAAAAYLFAGHMGDDHASRGHAPYATRIQQAWLAVAQGGDSVTEWVDDFGNQLAGLQVLARFGVVNQQPTQWRCHGFHRGQRRGVA